MIINNSGNDPLITQSLGQPEFIDCIEQAIVSAVGEHVENELVQQKLAGLGVDYAQGFHFHRPEPLMDALAAVESGDIANLMDPAEAVGIP